MMNFIDFLIIYFAVGAPLGVYYFFQKTDDRNSRIYLLRVFFAFVFWIPAAIQLFLQKIESKAFFKNKFEKNSFSDARRVENLNECQKKLEELFFNCRPEISLFDLRETIERFVGLTVSSQNVGNKPNAAEENILRAANSANISISAECLRRRNLNRLFYHQKLARQDFLQLISKILAFPSIQKELKAASFEFAELLNDEQTKTALVQMFEKNSQIESYYASKYSEKDLWNSKQPELAPPSRQISLRIQTMIAPARSRSKD